MYVRCSVTVIKDEQHALTEYLRIRSFTGEWFVDTSRVLFVCDETRVKR